MAADLKLNHEAKQIKHWQYFHLRHYANREPCNSYLADELLPATHHITVHDGCFLFRDSLHYFKLICCQKLQKLIIGLFCSCIFDNDFDKWTTHWCTPCPVTFTLQQKPTCFLPVKYFYYEAAAVENSKLCANIPSLHRADMHWNLSYI